MEKLKKYNVHAIICPDCKGNGYVKATIEEGREHIVVQSPAHQVNMKPSS